MLGIRTFKDPQGIFYPQSTKLLVIIAKTTQTRELYFPFELRLEGSLNVDIHDPGIFQRIIHLLAAGDCWRFTIKGQFNHGEAKMALEDAHHARKNKQIPSMIGLRAAARPWMDAQTG